MNLHQIITSSKSKIEMWENQVKEYTRLLTELEGRYNSDKIIIENYKMQIHYRKGKIISLRTVIESLEDVVNGN